MSLKRRIKLFFLRRSSKYVAFKATAQARETVRTNSQKAKDDAWRRDQAVRLKLKAFSVQLTTEYLIDQYQRQANDPLSKIAALRKRAIVLRGRYEEQIAGLLNERV